MRLQRRALRGPVSPRLVPEQLRQRGLPREEQRRAWLRQERHLCRELPPEYRRRSSWKDQPWPEPRLASPALRQRGESGRLPSVRPCFFWPRALLKQLRQLAFPLWEQPCRGQPPGCRRCSSFWDRRVPSQREQPWALLPELLLLSPQVWLHYGRPPEYRRRTFRHPQPLPPLVW